MEDRRDDRVNEVDYLTLELVQALTAMGFYVEAAYQMLKVQPRPLEKPLEALEKGLVQLTRLDNIARKLRKAIDQRLV